MRKGREKHLQREVSYASDLSVARYHFIKFSRPLSMFGASSVNFGSQVMASQCVIRHSRIGSPRDSVGMVSDEKLSWASAGSCKGAKLGYTQQEIEQIDKDMQGIPGEPHASTQSLTTHLD